MGVTAEAVDAQRRCAFIYFIEADGAPNVTGQQLTAFDDEVVRCATLLAQPSWR